jgi:cyclohexanecarboxyl-CoA dehydrogenase
VPVKGWYKISGVKSQAAFATEAGAAIVYARAEGGGDTGITAFLVPQDLPGLRKEIVPDLGERWMRRGTVEYDGVRIPTDHRIGEEGRAFEYLREELVRERALLASIYLGVGRASWDEVVDHVGSRRAFGRPLSEQQAVAFPLTEDGARLRAAELYVDEVLRRLDTDPSTAGGDAALAKWLAVDAALRAIDHAIQFHGGEGYSKALPHEQRWRDVRSGAIAHGPSEIMLRIAAREIWPRSPTVAGSGVRPTTPKRRRSSRPNG